MKREKYYSYIKSFLISEGPSLSSKITDAISEKFKVSKSYSRKILSNANSSIGIYHTGTLYFKDGQRGYSISSNANSFLELLDFKPRLKIAYELFINNTFVSKLELLKITGVLNLENSNYYDITKLINDLSFFFPNINSFQNDDGVFFSKTYWVSDDYLNNEIEKKRDLRLLDLKILPLALSYCKKINLIGNKAKYVSIDSPFEWIETRAQLAFDAVSYTKIGNNDSKSTICVFDISLTEYGFNHLEGFKQRYKTLINSSKIFKQRVIPILIVDKIHYSVERKILKENEIVILKLNTIFGSRITKFLEILHAHQIGNLVDLTNLIQVIESTNHAEQIVQFVPFAFELIVNATLNKILENDIKIISLKQNKLKVNGKTKEFDGFFEDEKCLYFVESKMYKRGPRKRIPWEDYSSNGKLEKHTLKYFFVEKYNFIKEWAESNNINKIICMCFVSTIGFYDKNNNMDTINKDINPIGELPLIITVNELDQIAKKKNIPISELRRWMKLYFKKDDNNIEIDFRY